MSLHDNIDGTLPELERAFWASTRIVAEQSAITVEDASRHMLRRWTAHLKDFRIHHAIDYADDGRAASWRVRLMLWRQGPQGQSDLAGDSDPGARFDQYAVEPGATVLFGLPAVATWALDLCTAAHPGATLDGLDAAIMARKLKSLRVALSNAGGESTWRLRYGVSRAAVPDGANPLRERGASTQQFMAAIHVKRETSPHNSR